MQTHSIITSTQHTQDFRVAAVFAEKTVETNMCARNKVADIHVADIHVNKMQRNCFSNISAGSGDMKM